MFEEKAIILREICNGIMFIGAIVMIIIFMDYILRMRREWPEVWSKDIAVRGAAAVVILMTGHALRAFTSWMEFLLRHLGHNPEWLTNALVLFLMATILIVLGKMSIIFAFSRYKWRWYWTIGASVVSVTIPVLIAVLVALA